MTDSPKCLNCMNNDKTGQTYKIAGKGYFLCRDCGTSYPLSSFQPIEFEWRTKKDEWKKFMLEKGVKVVS